MMTNQNPTNMLNIINFDNTDADQKKTLIVMDTNIQTLQ